MPKITGVVKPFEYKDMSKTEVIDLINYDLPINLSEIEHILDKIQDRYPFLLKSEISYIVKGIFECLRGLLIMGKELNFNRLFFKTKFRFYSQIHKTRPSVYLRVSAMASPALRGKKYD